MKRYKGALAALAGPFAVSSLAAGCSIVNSFGDVEPLKQAEGGASDATMEAASGSDAGEKADAGDAGVESAPRGVVVIGGTAVGEAGEEYVLTALDPSTGSELPHARENMIVSAVQYDAPNDVWYIFESGGTGIFPLPTDPFYIHTRRLDRATGEWTELAKTLIPPGLSFATTAVMTNSVAYVAYGEGDAGLLDGGYPAAYSLVVLNTTTPSAVTIDSIYPIWGSSPAAVVGIRSTKNPPFGGSATLGQSVKVGSANVTQLTTIDVSPGVSSIRDTSTGMTPVGSLVGYGLVTYPGSGDQDTMVVSRSSGSAVISVYSSLNDDMLSKEGVFPFGDTNIKPPAFSDCDQIAFVVGTNSDLNVYAVAMGDIPDISSIDLEGGPDAATLPYASAMTGHSGQGVYYEPYTKTVITPFSQGGNYALTAFTLGGSGSAPTLVQRQSPRWVPPADIRPNFVGTAIPYPPVCVSADE